MLSLDLRSSNPVLSALQIRKEDKIIAIKENKTADSNFIITHLIKQILNEKNKLCLVTFHNNLDHYVNVGRKLGYDINKAVLDDTVRIIDPLLDIAQDIELEKGYLRQEKEDILKCLFLNAKTNVLDLTKDNENLTYLIIDDVSHLLDLGMEEVLVTSFINYCVNLASDNVAVVINTHVSTNVDEIVANALQHVADVHVEVSPLKTGRSTEVTGVMSIQRHGNVNSYHFKTFDRGVKTFHPGESIYHLYK